MKTRAILGKPVMAHSGPCAERPRGGRPEHETPRRSQRHALESPDVSRMPSRPGLLRRGPALRRAPPWHSIVAVRWSVITAAIPGAAIGAGFCFCSRSCCDLGAPRTRFLMARQDGGRRCADGPPSITKRLLASRNERDLFAVPLAIGRDRPHRLLSSGLRSHVRQSVHAALGR